MINDMWQRFGKDDLVSIQEDKSAFYLRIRNMRVDLFLCMLQRFEGVMVYGYIFKLTTY